MGLIYKYTNKINDKVYIGKTKTTLSKRINHHRYKVRKESTSHFHNALRKYGEENFLIEVLIECNNDVLDQMEIKFIKEFNSNQRKYGYNLTLGGDGGDTFSLLTEEAKRIKIEKHRSQNVQGISSLMEKGKHVTASLSEEAQERWSTNFRESMHNISIRKKSGDYTDKEIDGLNRLRKFWNSEDERKRRSNRASGLNNSQYKGPYIVNGESYEFIKDVKEKFKVYGSVANIRRMLIAKGCEITF